MTEKLYYVRAGYYYEYTGICKSKEENLTTNEVCDKLNELIRENMQLKQQVSEQGTQIDFLKDENKHMRNVLHENEHLKSQLKKFKLLGVVENTLIYSVTK